MRRPLPALILALIVAAPAILVAPPPLTAEPDGNRPEVEVRVDPRVELLSIIFRLAGNPEYGKGRVPGYVRDVEEHFGKHRAHPAVRFAAGLRRRRGVSYDAVMGMAIHLSDDGSLAEAVPFDPFPEHLDRRWTVKDARRFLELARRFSKETGFPAFFRAHAPLYATAAERMRKVLAGDAGLDWFERFFGARPGASFHLVLGMLNGPACYGPHMLDARGVERIYCVLGVWSTDSAGKPRFDRDMLSTVAHEFCHSFVNPLVEKHRKELRSAGVTLYSFVREEMARQAYRSWETMMKESLVRACVVRYLHATRGERAAAAEARAQVARHFHWTPELSTLLADYERARGEYPVFDDFMPRVAAFLEEYAAGFVKEREARAEKTPHVVRMIPENGATDVDPSLRTIVVEFDRPMRDGAWSFVGGGPHFPKTTGRPSYDEERTTITLPVQLKPNWSYELWLNRGRFSSFMSEEGVPLEPVRVTFRTGAPR